MHNKSGNVINVVLDKFRNNRENVTNVVYILRRTDTCITKTHNKLYKVINVEIAMFMLMK